MQESAMDGAVEVGCLGVNGRGCAGLRCFHVGVWLAQGFAGPDTRPRYVIRNRKIRCPAPLGRRADLAIAAGKF